MISLRRILKHIVDSPLNRDHKVAAVMRFLKWQVGSRLVPGKVLVNWVNGARFIVERGETGLTGNVYNGLQEFEDMAYVLHVLEKSDCFVDIGANVGSYTLLACAAIGARGVCFEPVPQTFERLRLNLAVNHLEDRVLCLNVGVGSSESILRFTSDENCMNHVLAPGEQVANAIEVPVLPLDQALTDKPAMLKMDVEGYETPALEGARATLARPELHSFLIELNGSGERYGYDESKIVAMLQSFGFEPYRYDPWQRELTPLETKNNSSGNTLFIRDINRARERVKQAPAFQIFGKSI